MGNLIYENTPMQYTDFFLVVKMIIFSKNYSIFFFFFAQNIACGYTLELPRRVGYITRTCFPDGKDFTYTLLNRLMVS